MRNPNNEEQAVQEDYYSLALRSSRLIASNDDVASRPMQLDQLGGVATRTARIETLTFQRGYQGDLPLDAQPTIRKPFPWA